MYLVKSISLNIKFNRYRTLKFTDDNNRKAAIALLISMMKEEEDEDEDRDFAGLREPPSIVDNIQGKSSSKNSKFEDLQDEKNEFLVEQNELDRYMSFRLPERNSEGAMNSPFLISKSFVNLFCFYRRIRHHIFLEEQRRLS